MISKTPISGQKPHGGQLNTKVCDSKSAIFLFLPFFLSCYDFCSNNDNSKTVQALTLILARNGCSSRHAASQLFSVFIASNSPWLRKAILHKTLWLLSVVKDTIFNFVRMRTRSLVPRPNTTFIGLGTTLVLKRN